MKTTEQWLAGYVEVPPGEEKEGDVVIVGTTELPVYQSLRGELYAMRVGGGTFTSVASLRSLGCPVLRKREPLVWEGTVVAIANECSTPGCFHLASIEHSNVIPEAFNGKTVRIEEKL